MLLVSSLCFWINLPFGAVTVGTVAFLLDPQPAPPPTAEVIEYTQRKLQRWTFGKLSPSPTSILFRIFVLDFWGTVLMLGTMTLLLLPLQWGGNKYAWSNPIVVGTLCGFGALVIILVIFEWKFTGPSGILPLRFFKNRTQVGACIQAFFMMFCLLLGTYYLPIL